MPEATVLVTRGRIGRPGHKFGELGSSCRRGENVKIAVLDSGGLPSSQVLTQTTRVQFRRASLLNPHTDTSERGESDSRCRSSDEPGGNFVFSNLQAEVRKGCPHLNPPSFRAGHSLARPYNHTNHHYGARIGPEAPLPAALPSPVIPPTIDPRRGLVLYIAPACH